MIYLLYGRGIGAAMTDFINYAAFHGTPIRAKALMYTTPDDLKDATLVFNFFDLADFIDCADKALEKTGELYTFCHCPVVNPYLSTLFGKISLYSNLHRTCIVPYYVEDPKKEDHLRAVGETVLIRSSESHNQADIKVFHAPYEGALPTTYVTGTPMAVEFIKTEYDPTNPGYRWYCRSIVIGNNVIPRSISVYTGYTPAGTHDVKRSVEARNTLLPQLSRYNALLATACRKLNLDVAAVDYLLPGGIGGPPVVTDVTISYNSFRKEHLRSPFLGEMGIVEQHHALLLAYLRMRENAG